MATVNTERVRRFAVGVAQAAQLKALEQAVAPFARDLRKIRPDDVRVMVRRGFRLDKVFTEDLLRHELVQRLLRLDPDVLLRLLYRYHPKLATVLDTPEGREWWKLQQRIGRR